MGTRMDLCAHTCGSPPCAPTALAPLPGLLGFVLDERPPEWRASALSAAITVAAPSPPQQWVNIAAEAARMAARDAVRPQMARADGRADGRQWRRGARSLDDAAEPTALSFGVHPLTHRPDRGKPSATAAAAVVVLRAAVRAARLAEAMVRAAEDSAAATESAVLARAVTMAAAAEDLAATVPSS